MSKARRLLDYSTYTNKFLLLFLYVNLPLHRVREKAMENGL